MTSTPIVLGPKVANSSFITLIMKCDSPQGSKVVLPKVIGEEKSSFLVGRSMMDIIIVVNG